jgi:hypothetical protein
MRQKDVIPELVISQQWCPHLLVVCFVAEAPCFRRALLVRCARALVRELHDEHGQGCGEGDDNTQEQDDTQGERRQLKLRG